MIGAALLKGRVHDDVIRAWLVSGQYAFLNKLALVPRSEETESASPLAIKSDEGFAYFLVDSNGGGWIIKKFLPGQVPEWTYAAAIQSLIPRVPGFESGFLRTTLRGSSLLPAGFYDSEFRKWLEGTILMPQVMAQTWADVASEIRSEKIAPADLDMTLFCSSFSKMVAALESEGIAHRDLSSRNVLINVSTRNIHLVDWDSLYHASLREQSETICGTNGYIAPFVRVSGEEDVHMSWQEKSDRFALAVLNCEFLAMAAGSPSVEEGGLLQQSDIDRGWGPTLSELRKTLESRFPAAMHLLNQAINASTFEECPGPSDWLKLLRTHPT